jgi:hypothetical protein
LIAKADAGITFRALSMAKTSWIEKEKRKAATVAKYAELPR